MTIIQKPEPISFAGNLPEIILGECLQPVRIVLLCGIEEIVNEYLYPDSENRISLDIAPVIVPMLRLSMPEAFQYGFVQADAVKEFTISIADAAPYNFTVVRGGVDDLRQTAAEFLTDNFLTWQPQVKEVYQRQPEFLGYYAVVPSSLCIKAYFAGGKEGIHTIPLITGKLTTHTLNYDTVNAYFPSGQVSYYDVYVTDRENNRLTYIQRYLPVPEPDCSEIYLFYNTLGSIDTLVCTGTFTHNPVTQGILATIARETGDGGIDYSIVYEQNTGIIRSREQALWMCDFFVSELRYHFTDVLRKMYIEKTDNKYIPWEINSYTFEFRYSRQTIYNNVLRNRGSVPALLEFPTPEGLFFLEPRLSEYPVAIFAPDLMIPVQSPYSGLWKRIAARELSGGGSPGGMNYWSKEELEAVDGYLAIGGEKTKAGYADDAATWNGNAFSDLIDQPLRRGDSVEFKGIRAEDIHAGIIESASVQTENVVADAVKSHSILGDTVQATSAISGEYLTSGFISGLLGTGARLQGGSLELDSIIVRKDMTVRELLIERVKAVGGMLVLSAGAAKIRAVEDGGSYYGCSFGSGDGDISAPFIAGDLVWCQTFSGGRIKRYWRRVTSAGEGYFNLSKSDCEAGSAVPEAGDEVVQMGHCSDPARQKALLLCAAGVNAPYIDQYDGIDTFDLSGKLVVREGNLSGIVDSTFGTLSGSGLYAGNVYLKGAFAMEATGRLDQKLAQMDNNAGAAASQLQSHTAQITQLQVDQNGFSVRVGNVEQKATTTEEALNNLQTGGTNYINGTRDIEEAGNKYNELIIDESILAYLRAGCDLVMSFRARALNFSAQKRAEFYIRFLMESGYEEIQIPIDFTGTYSRRFEIKFNVAALNYVSIDVAYIITLGTVEALSLSDLMLEVGNKASGSWFPSLADQQAAIDAAKSAADNAQGTANAARQDITQITTQVTELKADVNGFNVTVTQVNEKVDKSKQEAIDTATLNASRDASDKVSQAKEEANAYTDRLTENKTSTTIDATALDETKYYPVVFNLSPRRRAIIKLNTALHNDSHPSWATHAGGFTVQCVWSAIGNGGGTTAVDRIIDNFYYGFASVIPAGNIGQMESSNNEYIYVRGGGKYHFVTTNVFDISLKTSDFTVYNQTIGILDSVSVPVPDMAVVKTELSARITAAEGKIELRATKDEFNALGARVSSAESQITTIAGQIDLTVRKDNVISSINQTAEAIRINASKIEITGQTIFRDGGGNVVNIFGGNTEVFNINGKFIVDKYGKAIMNDCVITGGTLSIGTKFFVDNQGNVTVNSCTITGGNLIGFRIIEGQLQTDAASILDDRLVIKAGGKIGGVPNISYRSRKGDLIYFGAYMENCGLYAQDTNIQQIRGTFIGDKITCNQCTVSTLAVSAVTVSDLTVNGQIYLKKLSRVSNTSGWDRMLVNLSTGQVAYG